VQFDVSVSSTWEACPSRILVPSREFNSRSLS
jgi:hypothetical protein